MGKFLEQKTVTMLTYMYVCTPWENEEGKKDVMEGERKAVRKR